MPVAERHQWPRCIGCDAPVYRKRSEFCRLCALKVIAWRRKTGWTQGPTELPPVRL